MASKSSFGAEFARQRAKLGAGKTFTYNGKSYSTNMAGEGGGASAKPVRPMAKPVSASAPASSPRPMPKPTSASAPASSPRPQARPAAPTAPASSPRPMAKPAAKPPASNKPFVSVKDPTVPARRLTATPPRQAAGTPFGSSVKPALAPSSSLRPQGRPATSASAPGSSVKPAARPANAFLNSVSNPGAAASKTQAQRDKERAQKRKDATGVKRPLK